MDQQTTLRDFLKVLFRQKAVVITSFITVIITVIIGLLFQTPVYQGSVKLMVSAQKQVESPYYRDLIGDRNMEVAIAQSEIVSSNPVIERAVKAVGLFDRPLDYEKNFATPIKKPFIALFVKSTQSRLSKIPEDQKKGYLFRMAVEDLKRNVKVEPIRDTNLFTISVRDHSPVGSAILANVVSRSYLIFDLQQQLAETQLKYGEKHPSSLQLQDSISAMIKNLNGQPLPDVEAIGPASVKIVEQATLPLRPTGIPKPLTFVLAVFMAVFLSVMLAFVFEYMDQSFKSPQEVEQVLNIPYLGDVPKNAKPDSFRNLSNQLYLMMNDKKLKTVLFFSALPEEGVTNTIANLGAYLAKTSGNKVMMIDANFRDSALGKNFHLQETGGLGEILEGKITCEKAVKQPATGLSMITAGRTSLNPVTLLDSNAMKDVLNWCKDLYDIVLVDVPNLREYMDAVILSTSVDANCLVVTECVTRKQVVQNAIAPIQQKKANIIGVILNNRSFVLPQAIYDMA
jgi:capsular exopolysaccharide synthesis family protein